MKERDEARKRGRGVGKSQRRRRRNENRREIQILNTLISDSEKCPLDLPRNANPNPGLA